LEALNNVVPVRVQLSSATQSDSDGNHVPVSNIGDQKSSYTGGQVSVVPVPVRLESLFLPFEQSTGIPSGSTPQPKSLEEASMSTATTPVVVAATPVSVKETVQEKIETVFDHIGDGIIKFNNAFVNIGNEVAPSLEKLLPAPFATGMATFFTAATAQLASTDAELTSINSNTTEAWGARAAAATAAGGLGLLALLANMGVTITSQELPSVLATVGTLATQLKLTGVTAAPVPATVA
jgi:hypothetical protein